MQKYPPPTSYLALTTGQANFVIQGKTNAAYVQPALRATMPLELLGHAWQYPRGSPPPTWRENRIDWLTRKVN